MARSYAHVYLTIWNDPDFRTLTPDGQWLYFVMLTHPTINSCGVVEWREARLINMAEGMTIERLRQAAWDLAQRRMIAVDPDTEEALVRSFVRHDGGLKMPNPSKGIVREHGAIASLRIMELVSREVRRAIAENPDWKGSEVVQPVLKQFTEPLAEGSVWVPDWFQMGSKSDGSKKGEPFRLGSVVPNPQPLTPKEEISTSAETDVPNPTPKTRGTRLPAGWEPTITGATERLHKELETEWVTDQLERFHDHWAAESTAKAIKLDWEAAWRTWLKNAIKWDNPKFTDQPNVAKPAMSAADRAWQTPKRDPRFFPEDYAS